jgi:hypothetical protein
MSPANAGAATEAVTTPEPVSAPEPVAASSSGGVFIEIGHFQKKKKGESAPGDVFLAQKIQSEKRIIAALSDGLGSGIKANVLASLTATMISKFVVMNIPPKRAAEIIVNSLPVCSERGLAYATFTLVDARQDLSVKIIEYDNPPLIILRGSGLVHCEKNELPIERKNKKTGPQKNETLFLSELTAEPGDRIIFFSDGVTQAGLGGGIYPSGWGIENVREYAVKAVKTDPLISAGELSRRIVESAENISIAGPKDDISCAVLYFRKPRNLLLVTGPPFHPKNDGELARVFAGFNGKKVISGGTSAQIIARELGKTISAGASAGGGPQTSDIDGAELVCEGILTLGAAAETLASGAVDGVGGGGKNPQARLVELFLCSDSITFMVGTKINEAHQDPDMPVELEIRRNVVKRIAALLEEKYMKAVNIRYL